LVVPYTETEAKVAHLGDEQPSRQQYSIRLARLLVDLNKTYTATEIRSMTGIGEDAQTSVLELLKVPDFKRQTESPSTSPTSNARSSSIYCCCRTSTPLIPAR